MPLGLYSAQNLWNAQEPPCTGSFLMSLLWSMYGGPCQTKLTDDNINRTSTCCVTYLALDSKTGQLDSTLQSGSLVQINVCRSAAQACRRLPLQLLQQALPAAQASAQRYQLPPQVQRLRAAAGLADPAVWRTWRPLTALLGRPVLHRLPGTRDSACSIHVSHV